MKKFFCLLICFCIEVTAFSIMVLAAENIDNVYRLSIQGDEIQSIDFTIRSGQGTPQIVNEIYLSNNFSYSTNSTVQIAYIVHCLNSFDFIDDGKTVTSSDETYANIKLKSTNGTIQELRFIGSERFFHENRQYAVNLKEYLRFIDFLYNLKTEKIVLGDTVTFSQSVWAKDIVNSAIDNDLVPLWNQINYQTDITRLEVCQLIANLLEKGSYMDETSPIVQNPFIDTKDIDVILLYQYGIINGKSDTEFCPYDYITREELACILNNTYYLITSSDNEAYKLSLYEDRDEISQWALKSVDKMTSIGVFMGNGNNLFEPRENITKEQMIIALYRLHATQEDRPSV